MKKRNVVILKTVLPLAVAVLFLVSAVFAAVLILSPLFTDDTSVSPATVISLEKPEEYLSQNKPAEEVPETPKEETPEVETPKEEPEKEVSVKVDEVVSEDDKEYQECMEKVYELEKTLSSDPDAWNMVLCNPTHPLPDGYIENINLKSIFSSIYKVDSRIWYNVKAMFLAAKKDGINLTMVSAFRDLALQTRNFNNKKNYYINSGMTEDEAYAKTATIIAVPGTSEHHTGLALDILCTSYTSLTADFDRTEAYKWLNEHCTEYGFILRYAKDKTDVTKIIYEPWHYRFVGIENAKKIAASGLCYEEYLGILD